MDITQPEALVNLAASLIVLMIGFASFAHILGGSKWSGRVVGFYWKTFRWTVGLPFVALGALLSFIGKKIRGGGGNNQSGNGRRGRRNGHP